MHAHPDQLALFVQSLCMLQGMHPSRRALLTRADADSETWAYAFQLAAEVAHIFPSAVGGIGLIGGGRAAQHRAYLTMLRMCARALAQWLEQDRAAEAAAGPVPPAALQSAAAAAPLVTVSTATALPPPPPPRVAPVAPGSLHSYHLPLHRLLAMILSFGAVTLALGEAEMLGEEGVEADGDASSAPSASAAEPLLEAAEPLAFDADLISHIVDAPLRLHAVLAQTRAGMWVRNGQSAAKPAVLYRSPVFADAFVIPDVVILQLGLMRLGAARFIDESCDRFGIKTYWASMLRRDAGGRLAPGARDSTWGVVAERTPADGRPSTATSESTARDAFLRCASEQPLPPESPLLAEEMMLMLVYVLSERSMLGETAAASARRQLVHRLASTEGATHSEICSNVSRKFLEDSSFLPALNEVADYVAPQGMAQVGARLWMSDGRRAIYGIAPAPTPRHPLPSYVYPPLTPPLRTRRASTRSNATHGCCMIHFTCSTHNMRPGVHKSVRRGLHRPSCRRPCRRHRARPLRASPTPLRPLRCTRWSTRPSRPPRRARHSCPTACSSQLCAS